MTKLLQLLRTATVRTLPPGALPHLCSRSPLGRAERMPNLA